MEQQIKEIINRIDALEKLINVIQQNLNSNIQFFLACLALVAATSVLAIIYYVKVTVNKKVEQELDKKLDIIKDSIRDEMKDYIKTNPQVCYAKGTTSPIIVQSIGYDKYVTISIYLGQKISLDFPTKLEVYYIKDNEKIKVEDMQANIGENDSIKIKYKMPQGYSDMNIVNWNIIWRNELYK